MKNKTTTIKDTTEFRNKLISIINKNKEGFTIDFDLKPINKKNGYCVALTNNSNKNIYVAIEDLFILIEKFKHFNNKLFIGGWLDIDTNTYFLDLSIYCRNKEYSLLIGKLFNQKSIFDIKNLNCINVDYKN
jgi:hypothetical protein